MSCLLRTWCSTSLQLRHYDLTNGTTWLCSLGMIICWAKLRPVKANPYEMNLEVRRPTVRGNLKEVFQMQSKRVHCNWTLTCILWYGGKYQKFYLRNYVSKFQSWILIFPAYDWLRRRFVLDSSILCSIKNACSNLLKRFSAAYTWKSDQIC